MNRHINLKSSFLLILAISLSVIGFGQCNIDSEWTFNPSPVDGELEAGETIEVCVALTNYTSGGANWMWGMGFDFPPAWDMSTLNVTQVPASCSGNGGSYIYVEDIDCPGAPANLPMPISGFFYDSPVAGPYDGNPCNNWGDPCFGGASNWEMCFEITLTGGGPGNPYDGQDITPTLIIYGDVYGGWGTATGCSTSDEMTGPDTGITLNACDSESGVSPGTLLICENGAFNLRDELTLPYGDGTWTGPAGWTDSNPPFGVFDPLTDPPGDYTYTVLGTDNCENSSVITMEYNDLGIVAFPGYCLTADTTLFLFIPSSTPYNPGGTWTYPNGNAVPGGILQPLTDPPGVYTYTFYNSNNCLTTLSVSITLASGGGSGGCPATVDLCTVGDPFCLLDLLGCNATGGGSWIHQTTDGDFYDFYPTSTKCFDPSELVLTVNNGQDTLVDANGDPVGSVFTYALGQPPCTPTFVDLTINIFQPANTGTFTEASVCVTEPPFALESLLSGNPDLGLDWTYENDPVPQPFDPTQYPINQVLNFYYSGGLPNSLCQTSTVLLLTITPASADAGDNNSITVCATDPPFPMLAELNGTPNAGGIWQNSTNNFGGGGFFVPGQDPGGTYSYTVTTNCGSDQNFLVINVLSTPSPGTSGTLTICSNDVGIPLSDGLTGSPSGAGTWSGPTSGNTVDGAAVTNGAVYTYTTGTAPCQEIATVTIDLQPAPFAGTAVTTPQVFCSTDAAFSLFTLLATLPSSQVATGWTGPAGFNQANLDPATAVTGNYTYTLTSPNCGQDVETIFITIETAPNAGANNNAFNVCPNATATVNLNTALSPGATAPGTWAGPNGAVPGGIFNPGDPAGVYTYTVSSPSGLCSDQATVNVQYQTIPSAGTNGSITVCASDAAFSLLSVLGGSPATTGGTWFNPIGNIVPGGSNAQFNPANGSGVYTYVLSPAGCPAVSTTATITVVPDPNAGTNTNVTVCASSGNIDLLPVLGGNPDATGTWTLAGNPESSPYDVTGLGGTTLVFTYEVTTGSCSESATLTLTVANPPNAGGGGTTDLCATGGSFSLLTLLPGTATAGSFTGGNNITLNAAASGTYTYVATGNQCPDDSDVYTLNVDPVLSTSNLDISCTASQTNYVVSFTISGGDGNYLVNSIASGANFVSGNIPVGQNQVFTISDGGPCSNTVVNATSPNCNCPVTASFIGGNQTICTGSSTSLELDLAPANGSFDVVYSIGGVDQPPLIGVNDGDVIPVSPTATTTYELVSVNDANCTGSASGSITVNVEALPNAGADQAYDFCATNGPVNLLSFLANPSPPAGGSFVSNNIVLNAAASGDYIYTVQGNVCPDDQATYTLNIDAPITTSNLSAICNPLQTGYTVSFTINGGDGNYVVTPAGSGSLVGNVFTSNLIPNLPPDGYNFTVSDGGPCGNAVVSGSPPSCNCTAQGSIAGSTTVCAGGSATLTLTLSGNGPFDVSYTNSNDPSNPVQLIDVMNGHTIIVSPMATATYTLLNVFDTNCQGIVNGGAVTVTVNQPITTSNAVETCNSIGESYTVSFTIAGGSGGYNVTPAGGNLNPISGLYTSVAITTGTAYSFTVDDSGPCPAVVVGGNVVCPCTSDAGTINTTPLEVCANSSATAVANGNATLDGNDALQFVLHDGTANSLGTVLATSSTGTFAYSANLIFGQTYYIATVVGNINGLGNVSLNHPCTDVSQGVAVVFNALPTASISGAAQVCPGEAVSFNVVLTGEGPWDFSYAVGGGDPIDVFSPNGEYDINTNQPGTYTLISVSDNNCSGTMSGSASLLNYVPPTAVLGGDPDVCENTNDGPLVTFTGTAPWNFVFAIDGEEQPPVTSNFPNYTIPAELEGVYTLISLDGPNCAGTVSGSLDVNILDAPSAMISGGGAVCAGEVANFNVSLTGNGPWTVQYAVDGVPQQPLNITQPNYSFQSGVDGDYVIAQVSDQNCSGEVIANATSLNVTPLPEGEISTNSNLLCIGQELQLSFNLQGVAPFNITYVIDGDTVSLNGLSNTFTQTLSPTEPLVAELLYIGDGSLTGCSSEPNISTFVQVAELPNAPELEDIEFCAGTGSVSIGTAAAPGLTYSWYPTTGLSKPDIANPTLSLEYGGITPKVFSYVVTASNGECSAQDTAFITINPGPRTNFSFSPKEISGEDPTVYFSNLTLGQGDLEYFWTFDSLGTSESKNPVFTFPDAVIDTYTISLLAVDPATGCKRTFEQNLSIRPQMLLFIPNAFTPDGDGKNDLWGPVLQNVDEENYRLTVYDRYGATVFDTRDPDLKWNGSDNGSLHYVQSGVYVWKLETKNEVSLEEFEMNGIVTVVR